MAGTHEYAMSGVKVKFPAKAYPSQVAMMSKIVTSIQRSQNSLLESPTGSGKSLALLCAALAWQESEQKKADEFNRMLEQATINQDPVMKEALIALAGNDGVEYEEDNLQFNVNAAEGGGFIPIDPDDADFQNGGAPNLPKPIQNVETTAGYHLPGGVARQAGSDVGYLKLPKKKKCPKIYFGTRTHKQVAQIVRELRKTEYAGVRMTILASREHTCIHPTISKSFNKNQDCQDLMDKRKGGGCRFQANVKQKMASHHSVRAYIGSDQAWDLEDLVKAGKKVKCCPYFAVRELKNAAQIVICPYNYLVEPNIRSSMEIYLKNQVVILDEAHNIEDSAREAASGSFKLDDVTAAMQDCERMVESEILPEVHGVLAAFLSRLGTWMLKAADEAKDYSDFNSCTKVWDGTSGVAEWNEIVFYPATYDTIKDNLKEAMKEQSAALEQNDDGFEGGPTKVLSKKTSDLIGGIFTVLDFMHRKNCRYRDDYKISVVKAQERKRGGKAKGWTGRGDAPALVHTVTLNFWCLNPGVCFDELLDCRSIILTSGTLSPMVTFASELEVKFPITLEANHVIDKSQVWVGTLSQGPTGSSLNAAYQNANTYSFQDEVGRLVLDICRTIPHGVLVFFPSYKMLNDLSERWKSNGTWQQLFQKKAIVSEPRFTDQFDVAMKEFYGVIEASRDQPNEYGQDGALFMAVCRGKVSEGLDFADNNARAVVCVGIPFPAYKDTLVDLKKKYNDGRRSTNPNILPGREWYEIQAFRALNQALGRCIRHKKDWGAILMVDDRYSHNPRYINSLSKWVRGKVVGYNNCDVMINSLKTFTADMKLFDLENSSEVDVFSKNTTKSDIAAPVANGNSYFSPKQGHPSSAWSETPDQLSLASKVASLVSLRKSSPDLNKNKVVSTEKPIGLGRNQARDEQAKLPNLSSGSHLDTRTNLSSVLDSRSNLNGFIHDPCNNQSSETHVHVVDNILSLMSNTHGMKNNLSMKEKSKQSKVVKHNPVEDQLPVVDFSEIKKVNSDPAEESFQSLYTDTSNTSVRKRGLVSGKKSNENMKTVQNKVKVTQSSKNLRIIQSQSRNSKMEFISSDESEPELASNQPSDSILSIYKPSVVDKHPKLEIVEAEKDDLSKDVITIPRPPSPNFLPVPESCKNSSLSSPECTFDLTDNFDLSVDISVADESSTLTRSSSNFKHKLQKFRFDPDDSGDKHSRPDNKAESHRSFSAHSSGPNQTDLCNVNIEPSCPVEGASGNPSFLPKVENTEDSYLIEMMLKRRRDSGNTSKNQDQSENVVVDFSEAGTTVGKNTVEMEQFDLGSEFFLPSDDDFEQNKFGPLVDVSNQPVSTKKPLFGQKKTNVANKPIGTSKMPTLNKEKMILSSDDVTFEVQENQPSVVISSSADDIEEPEEILRKVKTPVSKKRLSRKKRSRGVDNSVVESTKKGRLSFTLGSSFSVGYNSDDDFM